MKTRIAILIFVAYLALAVPVLAQVSSNHDLSWHVVGGSSERMASSGHTLLGTAGQALVGSLASSGHTLCSGFWCGAAEIEYQVYLPLVVRNFQ